MHPEPALPELAPRTRVLDVRPILRAGGEPFEAIMRALDKLEPCQGLAVRATFEPRPLFGLMAARGFGRRVHRLSDEDWVVEFLPGEAAGPGPGAASSAVPSGGAGVAARPRGREGAGDASWGVMDVRGLEPPEPLVRILARCQELPEGGTLKVVHERRPELLYSRLDSQGLLHRTEQPSDGLVELYITRPPRVKA